jgi:uncharacterized protein YndB with AHSA1/START domain
VQRVVSRWGEHGPRPTPRTENSSLFGAWSIVVSEEFDCPADAVWSLITDIARIGEFSPECIDARWTTEEHAAVGARFDGTNSVIDRNADGEELEFVWVRPCEVTAFEPEQLFAYSVGDRYDGSPVTNWEFRIEATSDTTCRVTQTFRHQPDGLSGIRHSADADPQRAAEIIADRTAGLSDGMRATLRAMRSVLARP